MSIVHVLLNIPQDQNLLMLAVLPLLPGILLTKILNLVPAIILLSIFFCNLQILGQFLVGFFVIHDLQIDLKNSRVLFPLPPLSFHL